MRILEHYFSLLYVNVALKDSWIFPLELVTIFDKTQHRSNGGGGGDVVWDSFNMTFRVKDNIFDHIKKRDSVVDFSTYFCTLFMIKYLLIFSFVVDHLKNFKMKGREEERNERIEGRNEFEEYIQLLKKIKCYKETRKWIIEDLSIFRRRKN